LSFLYCADDEDSEENVSQDRFHKVQGIFDLFNQHIFDAYNMSAEISIDESLLLWQGNHAYRRYILSKVDRWGFKFYVLAES
jgi:hypothetical protein